MEQIDKDKDKIPDVILDQTADIVADMITLDRARPFHREDREHEHAEVVTRYRNRTR